MKCPHCNSTLLEDDSDFKSHFCETCDKVIDFDDDEPILEDDEIQCTSCQRILDINSEDLCNTTCRLCGGEAC